MTHEEHQKEQEEQMQSEEIAELATALAKAQGKITGAQKGTKNTFFNSSYADLAACWDACREALSENGLSVVQAPRGTSTIDTLLLHSSGQWIKSRLTVKPTKDDAQGQGSALTYARRYALAAMVGLAQVDDDGNAASKKPETHFKSKQTKTKVWKALKDAAAEDDDLKARETWDELDSDEQQEIWQELSSGQRSTLKTLLAKTQEAS